jgi:hypothetical protein
MSIMTDPFFRSAWNANQQAVSQSSEDQKKIQDIMNEQKKMEEDFLQLNDYLKNASLTDAQKLSVQNQMQQLDFRYKQNINLLKSLGVGTPSVKANSKTTRPLSKISVKTFLIGCASILFTVVGGLAFVFYYLVENPAQMATVGVNPATAKNLLQVFIVIFFGFLFLLWFALLVVNGYRLFTVKNKSRVWYFFGLILGIFVFLFSVSLGAVLLDRINSINPDDFEDGLLRYYLVLKDRYVLINDSKLKSSPKLIAPALINFQLNTILYNSNVLPWLWQVSIQWLQLDCGNWQKLDADVRTLRFERSCIYYTRWNYPLNLVIYYINPKTSERMQKSFSAWSLSFLSEIKITNTDNSVANIPLEVVAWKVPSKVTFDASSVFRDFNLLNYNVLWDVDGDWVLDKVNTASITHVYKEAKVYQIGVRFPDLNDILYLFPLRVEQSDVPVCEVSIDLIKWTEYSIKTTFLDPQVEVTDYQFDILESGKWKTIDTKKDKKSYINYVFSSKWSFSAVVNFITSDWKKWQCESENIEIGQMDFTIMYDLYYRSPSSPNYVKVDRQNSGMIQNWDLIIREVPSVVKVDITKVLPDRPGLVKRAILDWKPVLSSDWRTFEFTIDESKEYEIKIIVEDVNHDAKSEQIINVAVKKDDIIWRLLVTPSVVGIEPFDVKFDASTTTVYDMDDEIIYFTRNFGDWEIKKNFSQSVVTHTYRYDAKNENWEYFPTVTVKTKKWREAVIGQGTRILIKKALVVLTINIDSHPAQSARVWDKIDFSLEMNWLPKTITWDFGDGNNVQCNARECITASKVYSKPWTYTINVLVTFENQPDLRGSITMKVQ